MKTWYDFRKDEVPFTQVANGVLKDKDISMKAKGLYAYLYSKPSDWQFSYERIVLEMGDGKAAVLSAIKELERAKLLKRLKQSDGRTVYWVTYPPGNFKEPATENQQLGTRTTYRKSLHGKIGSISNKENSRVIKNKGVESSTPSYKSKTTKKMEPEYISTDEDGNPIKRKSGGSKPKNKLALQLVHEFADMYERRFKIRPTATSSSYFIVIKALSRLNEDQIRSLFKDWVYGDESPENIISLTRCLSTINVDRYRVAKNIK